jgi:hypothetical protein
VRAVHPVVVRVALLAVVVTRTAIATPSVLKRNSRCYR